MNAKFLKLKTLCAIFLMFIGGCSSLETSEKPSLDNYKTAASPSQPSWAVNPTPQELDEIKPTRTLRIINSPFPLTATAVPPGTFVVLWYPPWIMNYDPTIWVDITNYSSPDAKVGNLLVRKEHSCSIGIMGPSGFSPCPCETKKLGALQYSVKFDEDAPVDQGRAYYFQNAPIASGIIVVSAEISEWEECQLLAEDVLSTAHVP